MNNLVASRFLGIAQSQGQRNYQEDDFGVSVSYNENINAHQLLVVLADGMGGHIGGAEASSIVTRQVIEFFSKDRSEYSLPDNLESSILRANDAITNHFKNNPSKQGMGSTVIVCLITNEGVYFGSVGDSPLLLWKENQLTRLNEDHSMAPVLEDMVAAGRLTAEEAASDKSRNALRSVITGEEISLMDISETPITIEKEDVLIVASDGIDTLSSNEIAQIITQYKSDMGVLAQALLVAVEKKENPKQDNVTILALNSYELQTREEVYSTIEAYEEDTLLLDRQIHE